MSATATLDFEVEDFTGTARFQAREIAPEITVGEFIDKYSRLLDLPQQDGEGRQILYGAIGHYGDVLNSTDLLGDVIRPDDVVVLTKTVTAG